MRLHFFIFKSAILEVVLFLIKSLLFIYFALWELKQSIKENESLKYVL